MATTFTPPAFGQPVRTTELLFALDPDLADALPPDEEAAVGDVRVRCVTIATGRWRPTDDVDARQIALLVTSGRLAASFTVAGRHHAEILGPGDVCQPWLDGCADASLPQPTRWQVLQDSQIAILDRRFAIVGARSPALMRTLMERLTLRSRRLLFQLATLSIPQITTRIELVMWHFASRWGHVTPSGIALELPLTHELLAHVVGAQRPSVTTALGDLRERGRLDRRDDGTWLLAPDPPAALAARYGTASLSSLHAD